MNIIINTFCNLHCPYCFADDAKEEYGKNIIKQYSEKIMVEVVKKYNERNLRYMRQLYELIK